MSGGRPTQSLLEATGRILRDRRQAVFPVFPQASAVEGT